MIEHVRKTGGSIASGSPRSLPDMSERSPFGSTEPPTPARTAVMMFATTSTSITTFGESLAAAKERLGFVLLERSSRGVRPTAAGEIVFSEATEILRQLEQLPGMVRSSNGDVEGIVNFGMTVAIAGALAGPAVAACKQALPKVTLKFSDGDSDVLQARIEAQTLDMAVVFEDHFMPNFSRHPLYRQRLYLVTHKPLAEHRGAILRQAGERVAARRWRGGCGPRQRRTEDPVRHVTGRRKVARIQTHLYCAWGCFRCFVFGHLRGTASGTPSYKSPLPERERAECRSSDGNDPQVFFSIGQTLFSSGMNASVAGIVATRL